MNDTTVSTSETASETVTPNADPTLESGERYVTGTWNVGPADSDGWVPQAHLYVTHNKGVGYRATLYIVHERNGDGYVQVTVGVFAPSVRLHTQDAPRFNRAALNKAYEAALAELRRRFQDGDIEVMAYFDLASTVFTK